MGIVKTAHTLFKITMHACIYDFFFITKLTLVKKNTFKYILDYPYKPFISKCRIYLNLYFIFVFLITLGTSNYLNGLS